MISIEALSVEIESHTLLGIQTLEFLPGEFTIIVGPNGAGKTTLLKCIDGEIAPSTGKIVLENRLINDWSELELAKMRAVLPQQSALDFPFTVEDVVLMGRIPHGTSDEVNKLAIKQSLELCDCHDLSSRSYVSLSGGEQQRVQTARIFAQIWQENCGKNRFLLLDEPVSALDLNHQYALMRNLKSFAENENIGVICTLHNLNLAAQFAERTVVLDKGVVVADGKPSDVFTEETLSNVFNLNVMISNHPQDLNVPLIIPKIGESK